MKKVRVVNVDGVKVMQLFIDNIFITEVEISSQFSAKQAKQYLLSI